jgi:hypothetical protein
MQPIQLFGKGVGTQSSNVSAQTRTNLYVEQLAEPDKTVTALFARPGLVRYAATSLSGAAVTSGQIKAGVITGPIRGIDVNYVAGQTSPSSVFGVLGNITFQYLNGVLFYNYPNYLTSSTFGTSTGRVSIVNDGINIGIADGQTGYYAPNGTPSQMQPITDVDFPQTTPSMCILASRTICVDPAFVGRFRWSAAGDITTWDPLSFATAESNSDSLTAVFEANGELLLFGTQTIEFWGATGDTDVFRRIGSSGAQCGTEAIDTIRKVGNRVMFMGREQVGTQGVYLLDGYQPRRVSTPDVDNDIQSAAATATATVVSWKGHTFYLLNLPSKTWAYDLRDGTWSIWQSAGSRFYGQYQAQFGLNSFVSSYIDNALFVLTDGLYTDDSNIMVREVTTRHVINNLDRMTCYELVVDAEMGVGAYQFQGSDPQIMLTISKDGGHTFGNEMWTTLGALGSYQTRAIWRRLGLSRDWVFKLRITDPVKLVLLGAYARFG